MTIPWNPIICSVKSSSFWQSQPENVEAQVARAARAARLATCYNKPGAYEVPRSAISWSCCGSRKKSTYQFAHQLQWNPMNVGFICSELKPKPAMKSNGNVAAWLFDCDFKDNRSIPWCWALLWVMGDISPHQNVRSIKPPNGEHSWKRWHHGHHDSFGFTEYL